MIRNNGDDRKDRGNCSSFIPSNTACVLKMVLDPYFTFGNDGIGVLEIISDVMMKSGYVTNFLIIH